MTLRDGAAPAPAVRRRAVDVALLLLLALVVVATWIPRLHGPLDLRWDAGVYYVLGTSLAEGRGYRLLNEPGAIAAVQYPPLLPAFIAAHQLISGTTDPVRVGRALRWSFLVLSLAFGWATYALLRTRMTPAWAFVGSVICAVHQFTAFLSDVCFAELPFVVVTCAFFVVSAAGSGRWREGLLGLLAAAAYGLRTAGVALFVAWIAESAVRGDIRRTAARLMMAAVPVLGWHAYVASVERSPAYAAPAYPYQRADYLFYNVSYARNMTLRDPDRPELGKVSYADLVARVLGYLPGVPAKLGETASAPRDALTQQIVELRTLLGLRVPLRLADAGLLMLAGLILGGLAIELVQRRPLLPFYVATYTLLLCVVPWHDQPRYWFPLAPLSVLALGRGALALADTLRGGRRVRLRWSRQAVGVGVALLLLVQVICLFAFYRDRHQLVAYHDREGRLVRYRLFYYREAYQALDAALDWLRDRAAPTDIVAASMPHWAYLRTGLRAVMPPLERDWRVAARLLDAVPVAYLIVDARTQSFTRQYGLPVMQQAPERWTLVHSLPEGGAHVFRRAAGSTGAGEGREAGAARRPRP